MAQVWSKIALITGVTAGLFLTSPLGTIAHAQPVPAWRVPADADRSTLVRHAVAPDATDPAIDTALDDHLAWLDRGAESRHRLFIFLPGTGVAPSLYQMVQAEAARLGYHVIGLMYPNANAIAAICLPLPDPETCYEGVRLQILTGSPQTGLVDVNRANSIENRLVKLLQYLALRYPREGWAQFLESGTPIWSHVIVAGHSQGAGHSVLIGKLRLVDRVVMFSGVTDGINGAAARWVTTDRTPPERYYGLVHELDPAFSSIMANWVALGLEDFGRPRMPETNSPPYRGTHRLVTAVLPDGGSNDPGSAHASTSVDGFIPLATDGKPLLLDAWDYMLGARATHEHDR